MRLPTGGRSRAALLRARAAGAPQAQARAAGASSIGRSDRQAGDRTERKRTRTMIRRSTKMTRGRMMMKSTIVKIIEDDI